MAEKDSALRAFRRLAETWGADVERWPAERRAWALTIAQEPEAAAILAEARRLDAVLATAPPISEARAAQVSAGVLQAISTPARRRRGGFSWFERFNGLFAPRGLGLTAAAASILVATVAGALLGLPTVGADGLEEAEALRLLAGRDLLAGEVFTR